MSALLNAALFTLALAPSAEATLSADARDCAANCSVAEPRRPDWHYEGIYFAAGVAPGTTVHLDGINPMMRFDSEIGMHWRRNKWEVAFGADAWLLKYFERKKVGGGLHGVVTVSRRPVYVRAGAGSLIGVPGSPIDRDVRPAVGGLVGFGLEGGPPQYDGRFGFDYHASVDKAGRLNNTFLLTMRFKFG